jgi:hypothetical protein
VASLRSAATKKVKVGSCESGEKQKPKVPLFKKAHNVSKTQKVRPVQTKIEHKKQHPDG